MLNYAGWELAPHHASIQQQLRSFVDKEVLELMPDCFERGSFPKQLIPRLAELGALGPDVPEYGGGLDGTSYGLICQELERADSGLRSFVTVQSSLVMFPIATYGSEAQRQRYLPGLRAGTIVGCFALTEPDHGSDPSAIETRAIRDPSTGEFVVNGTKKWIPNGPFADIALVWAKTDHRGTDEVVGFLVDADTPGYRATPIDHKLSLRVSEEAEIHLDDVRVPADAMLEGVRGLRGPLSCLNEARFGISFGVVGAAMSCLESALRYSVEREQWGRPIAGFQLTQAKLVDALQSITQGQLLAYQVGRLKDGGRLRSEQVSLAKRANTAMALDVARSLRSVLGGSGITHSYPIFRHMANLESVSTYEGTHEIHTLIVGADITGIPAFRG